MTRRSGARAIVLLVAGLSSACALTLRERGLVDAWLGCTECVEGQLDSVIALSRQGHKHSALVGLLRDMALTTPDTARIAAELAHAFQQDSVYAARLSGIAPSGWPTRAQWVNRHLRGAVVSLQARALVGLGAIRTRPALAALDSACVVLRDSLAVRAALRARFAYDSLSVPCRVRAGLPTARAMVSP